MESIAKLHLNAVGRKAMGQATKIIYLDKEPKEVYENKEYIEEMFPMSLVESFEVAPSFSNLNAGDEIGVFIDGTRYLGVVAWKEGKMIHVRFKRDLTSFEETLTFHPHGIEATHYKHKAILVYLTNEEKNALKEKLRNSKFLELMTFLTNGSEGVQIDIEKLRKPVWLEDAQIDAILNILNSEDEEEF